MSKFFFLNGCTSAGKTTLAKTIQHLSEELWLFVRIDALFATVSAKLVGFSKKAED